MNKRDAIPVEAYLAIRRLDQSFVGTPNYLGVAYFWHHSYRFALRDASMAVRRRVHAALLKRGLAVDGFGSEHSNLISHALHRAVWARVPQCHCQDGRDQGTDRAS